MSSSTAVPLDKVRHHLAPLTRLKLTFTPSGHCRDSRLRTQRQPRRPRTPFSPFPCLRHHPLSLLDGRKRLSRRLPPLRPHLRRTDPPIFTLIPSPIRRTPHFAILLRLRSGKSSNRGQTRLRIEAVDEIGRRVVAVDAEAGSEGLHGDRGGEGVEDFVALPRYHPAVSSSARSRSSRREGRDVELLRTTVSVAGTPRKRQGGHEGAGEAEFPSRVAMEGGRGRASRGRAGLGGVDRVGRGRRFARLGRCVVFLAFSSFLSSSSCRS
jgi:hypothetical protein